MENQGQLPITLAITWLLRQSQQDPYWAKQALIRYGIPHTKANIKMLLLATH